MRKLKGHTGSVVSLQVLKNGNLVSFSIDDTLKIWNPYLANTNLLLTITGHGNTYWMLSFGVLSNDCLVTCSCDQDDKEESTLRVWDSKNGQLLKSLPTGQTRVLTVLVLFIQQVAIGSYRGTIKIIDLEDGQKSMIQEKAHGNGVTCLLQSSNGNIISSGIDTVSLSPVVSIKVWNVSNLSLLQSISTKHSFSVYSMAISKDETWLASGSLDQTIKIWPLVFKQAQSN